jgi:hypothetical protein
VIAGPAVRAADLGHAQVHIGREPEVELSLAGACRRAACGVLKSRKPRLTGFFSL